MEILLKPRTVSILLILAFSLYASAFIFRTSISIGGERFFSLFDDAMISMRYARNLAEGHGLVWNTEGNRVEGITNPAWTLLMAGAHLLPLSLSKVSLVIQIVSALLAVGTLLVLMRAGEFVTSPASWAAPIAVGLTAFYIPLQYWGLRGMEGGLLTFILTYAVLAIFRSHEGMTLRWHFYAILGIATFVRIDFAFPAAILLGYLFVADRSHRVWNVILGLGTLILCLSIQTALRIWYYDDLLPNTYYLKMDGYPWFPRVTRGIYVTLLFLRSLHPLDRKSVV